MTNKIRLAATISLMVFLSIPLTLRSSEATGQAREAFNHLNSVSSKPTGGLVDELPDLIVRRIMSIQGHEIRVAVSNLGKANSGSCLIRAEVWKGGELSFKRDGTVKELHPGQYNIVTIDTSPHEVTENGFIIKLMVDPTDEVEESNENNNSKCKGCIAIPGKK